MESFVNDLKYSLRMFLKAPGFTITAVLALAIGIGANTAIFSVINRVLLKPMPYPDPDRFVFFMNTFPQGSGTGASPVKFNFWRAQTQSIESAAAWRFGVANFDSGGTPEQIQQTQAGVDFFKLVGARMLYGGRLARRRIGLEGRMSRSSPMNSGAAASRRIPTLSVRRSF